LFQAHIFAEWLSEGFGEPLTALAGVSSIEVRCGPYRPLPCRFCNCGKSL
jgi:hypothetical protein